MMSLSIIKILLPLITSFIVGIIIFPYIIKLLTHMHMWKKKSVAKSIDGRDAVLSAKIHNDENRNVSMTGNILNNNIVNIIEIITPIPPDLGTFLFSSLCIFALNTASLPSIDLATDFFFHICI